MNMKIYTANPPWQGTPVPLKIEPPPTDRIPPQWLLPAI